MCAVCVQCVFCVCAVCVQCWATSAALAVRVVVVCSRLAALGAGWLAGQALETAVRAHILKQVTGHSLLLLPYAGREGER